MCDLQQSDDTTPEASGTSLPSGMIAVGSGAALVDLAQRTASRRHQAVHLTQAEWRVLEVLLPQRGKAMTKPELAARVAQTPGVSVNALEVHLSNLRRKLGRDVVETIRGRGYRIRE
jgi:two-component system, OmpR family, response regulator